MKSILLVEGTETASLHGFLSNEGYEVKRVSRLADAERAIAGQPAVVVLGWMLSDGPAIDFVRQLRSRGNETPVVLVSPRTDVMDRVLGLEAGANDCVSHGWEPREVVARIRVQMRAKATRTETLRAGAIEMNLATREVFHRGRKVTLRKMEFDLLHLFLASPNRVFTREEILNKVWGYERFPTTRTVDTHMLSLRQKLDAGLFETVRGVGYRLSLSESPAVAA